jgi:hypothetical protein
MGVDANQMCFAASKREIRPLRAPRQRGSPRPPPRDSVTWHVQYVPYAYTLQRTPWAAARAETVDVAAADAHAQPLALPPFTDVDVQYVDALALAYACKALRIGEI